MREIIVALHERLVLEGYLYSNSYFITGTISTLPVPQYTLIRPSTGTAEQNL